MRAEAINAFTDALNAGFTSTEAQWLLGLIKEHLSFYEALSAHPKFSEQSRKQLVFLQTLNSKLKRIGEAC